MVSIVLPTYNGARYLRESVDSIICQTMTDWELIIVDDCSTDATPQIADEYARCDTRIHVIHNAVNQKLPRSLNIGFASARGEYLTWTSDDNIYMPEAIGAMQMALDEHPEYPMVCADMYTIDENGDTLGKIPPYQARTMFIEDTVGACFMYRHTVIDRIGGYDPNWFLVEDYAYWLQILLHVGRIYRVPQTLYYYRVHSASLTGRRRAKILARHGELMLSQLDEIIERYCSDQAMLYNVYYRIMECGKYSEAMREKIAAVLPEINREIQGLPEENVLIFGAGEYGHKAYQLLEDKCLCFIDNAKDKQGTALYQKPIYSLERARELYPQSDIVVAVAGHNIGDVILQLRRYGIDRYYTCLAIDKAVVTES